MYNADVCGRGVVYTDRTGHHQKISKSTDMAVAVIVGRLYLLFPGIIVDVVGVVTCQRVVPDYVVGYISE